MNIALPDPDKIPLKPAALAELALKAREACDNMKETHDAYHRKADHIRAEVASRFNSEMFRIINPAERRRVAEQETASRVLDVRKNALTAVNAIGQEQIGPIMAADRRRHPRRKLRVRSASGTRHQDLPRATQCRAEALQMECSGRRDTSEDRPGACRAE